MATSSRLKTSLRAVGHIVERRRHPQRFIQIDKCPWDEIYRDGIMAVRHYSLPPMSEIPVNDEMMPVTQQIPHPVDSGAGIGHPVLDLRSDAEPLHGPLSDGPGL